MKGAGKSWFNIVIVILRAVVLFVGLWVGYSVLPWFQAVGKKFLDPVTANRLGELAIWVGVVFVDAGVTTALRLARGFTVAISGTWGTTKRNLRAVLVVFFARVLVAEMTRATGDSPARSIVVLGLIFLLLSAVALGLLDRAIRPLQRWMSDEEEPGPDGQAKNGC